VQAVLSIKKSEVVANAGQCFHPSPSTGIPVFVLDVTILIKHCPFVSKPGKAAALAQSWHTQPELGHRSSGL